MRRIDTRFLYLCLVGLASVCILVSCTAIVDFDEELVCRAEGNPMLEIDCSSREQIPFGLDPACVVGSCDRSDGECKFDLTERNGESCSDNQLCTTDDMCMDGICSGTEDCEDGQSCDENGRCAEG